MNRRIMMMAAFAAIVAMATSAHADNDNKLYGDNGGGWRLIGTTHAGYTADHDTIRVEGPFDDFRKIKFEVKGADLNLQRLVVTYDNGEPDNIEVRENIRQGGESRAIDLRGKGKRSIRRIDFWYDSQGLLKGKADVRVFGLK